jgi:hypothetical protein
MVAKCSSPLDSGGHRHSISKLLDLLQAGRSLLGRLIEYTNSYIFLRVCSALSLPTSSNLMSLLSLEVRYRLSLARVIRVPANLQGL